MLPNTFIQNPTSDFSRGDVLETFINQLEVQKKMTSMLAMRGLQEYIRQFIQFQMFQDSLREKIIELQNSLNPHQTPATRHMDDKPTKKMTPDPNDFMKVTLQKMVEESFHQQSDSPSGTRSTKSFEEEPFQIKEIKENSRNLEKRLRDSVLNGSVPKVSRTKHISKVDMCDMTRIPRKPSKCEHDIHYAGGFCKECFVRVSQQVRYSNPHFINSR